MKKAGKTVLLIVVLAAVVLGAFTVAAFRTKPILKDDQIYTCLMMQFWLDGGNNDFEGRAVQLMNDVQIQDTLRILSKYEKKLSTQQLGKGMLYQILPAQSQSVAAEIPEWVEASIVVVNGKGDKMFNLVLGEGHAQIRAENSYLPPYYEIPEGQQLYEELWQTLGMQEMMDQLRQAMK